MQDFNPNNRLEKHVDKFELPFSILANLFKILLVSETKIRGLDLSHWNSNENIDFVELKKNGIEFVILKVTEGTTFVDPTFDYKYKSSLEAGQIVLPYHFFRSNIGGAAQSVFCIDTLQDLGFLDAIEYVPIIWKDVETSDSTSVDTRRNRLLAALQTTESNGFQGGTYSSPYYWNSLIGNVPWIGDYWQWDAHWTSASIPTLPWNWSRAKALFWQNGIHPIHSWVETVIGAKGNVDHNYFFGPLSKLKEILKFPTAPPVNCCDELKKLYLELKTEIDYLKKSDAFLNERVKSLESGQSKLYTNFSDLDVRLQHFEEIEETLRKTFC